MSRSHRHTVLLTLLSAAAMLGTNCGGGDDDAGPQGASAGMSNAGSSGKAGGSGRGGASGRAGANGEGGSNSEGGAGANAASGAGGVAGATDAAGSSGQPDGSAGEAGSPSEPIALTVADSASELIEASEGGTVTLNELTLVIPPDALEEDTEITIRNFEGTPGLFVLEPDGLEFETPITARVTYPAAEFEGSDEPGVLPVAAMETGSLGEPMELIESTSVQRDEDENLIVEGQLDHFSGLTVYLDMWSPTQEEIFLDVEDLTVNPAIVPVDVEFGVVGRLNRKSPVSFALKPFIVGSQPSGKPIRPLTLTPVGLRVVATEAYADGKVAVDPPERNVPLEPTVALEPFESIMVSRLFHCREPGEGKAWLYARFVLSATARGRGYTIRKQLDGLVLERGATATTLIDIQSRVLISKIDVTCLDQRSTLTALGAPTQLDALRARFKATWQKACYWLSDHGACQSPSQARAVINALDPVLEVGPVAAARLEAAFPCGDGPVGRTFCGTPGTFAEGDYVFVLATFGDDIPLADATSSFQHAFVFDADGDTANNYVPPTAYPDDFFAGTDKWYQLFYAPQGGFTLKVVDARISTSNPVASNARMVVAGRELSAFIPRAELDGTDPGFRVSSFRHEGDYGLEGGPWDLSYYPALGEELMPAAAGEPIVLPEE